jgi:uncharacterized protein
MSEFKLDGLAQDEKFAIINANLSPERPIRSIEFLRGRSQSLDDVVRELRHFHGIPFVYGYRGVGKTSLARTAAQQLTPSDREHAYVACAPGGRLLHVLREVGQSLLKIAFKSGKFESLRKTVELEISLSPAIRASFEKKQPELEKFEDMNAAIRVLRDLDSLVPDAQSTVVVIDELEVLAKDDQTDLAYLIKQLGDQEFKIRFVLVGIAQNIHELIGAHESVPRYIKEVSLQPLMPQDLIDVVEGAAHAVGVTVPRNFLLRIAIIGNGFPHFAHLLGKSLLIETVLANETNVTQEVYRRGVARAVGDSLQELKNSYDAATQRGEDYFMHLIWALAHSDVVDLRIDQWIALYKELADRYQWKLADDSKLRNAIGNFKNAPYGRIVTNTPVHYGAQEMRYRYKRFANMLMRGHVRLQAENSGTTLGREPGM